MSAAVNSFTGAQSDSIGGGPEGPAVGEESGSLESWDMRSAGLVFGSIAFKIAAPEVTSNRSSSKNAAGSESKIGAGACAAVGVLGTGIPRLGCLRRGSSGGPTWTIFINTRLKTLVRGQASRGG